MPKITVIDVRGTQARDGIEYIGRAYAGWEASPLGNPYKSIAPYKAWLWQQMKSDTEAHAELHRLANLVRNGESVRLGCWCKSKGPDTPCHGDVVKSAIEWILGEQPSKPQLPRHMWLTDAETFAEAFEYYKAHEGAYGVKTGRRRGFLGQESGGYYVVASDFDVALIHEKIGDQP